MTHVKTAQLHQTILPIHRHLSLQHGSRTLTRGRNKPTHTKTHSTTHRLLLCHVYPTERNYNIYKQELLAVIKALAHWRPHLAATKDPVTILTDHANLTYWKTP